MILTSMKRIVGNIFLNQCSGKEWLLAEAIVDLVRMYNYCSGDDTDDDVSKQLDTIVEERGNSPDAENLHSNLLEVHYKMRSRVKDKITNVLAPASNSSTKKIPLLVCSFLGPTVFHGAYGYQDISSE